MIVGSLPVHRMSSDPPSAETTPEVAQVQLDRETATTVVEARWGFVVEDYIRHESFSLALGYLFHRYILERERRRAHSARLLLATLREVRDGGHDIREICREIWEQGARRRSSYGG